MNFSRALQLLLCAIAAAVGVAGVWKFDRARTEVAQRDYGLHVARQIASQADGLAFAARARATEDPVGEALRTLSQGTDPRAITLSRIRATPGASTQHEERFDPSTGLTEYLKVLTPEDGVGVKVSFQQEVRGFLGARSQLESDLTSATLFFLVFSALVWMSGGFIVGFSKLHGAKSAEAQAAGHISGGDDTSLKSEVETWSTEAKATLVTLTAGLRDALKQTQRISKISLNSLDAITQLHSRVHNGLEGLHESKLAIDEGESVIAELEAASLSVVMEAHRLGPQGRALTRASTDVHRKIQRLRKAIQQSREAVEKLEINLEPCVTDADVALHAFDGFQDESAVLSAHVRKTTEAITAENRLIQSLNERLRA
jgi:hypothetical protein